ncbi:MAG: HPr family phosphocarrier protein [Deltaproteobacteria bacterium]|jgi:phosphotransferase system HPr (HPr) family protein|nr:HPr family phosphocarrier protein [Deltaproteobacteria bacterium]
MVSQNVVITCPSGLHARPLAKFVQLVKSFKSEVSMMTPKGEVSCRSIVALLSAAIKQGAEVELKVNGPDELDALPRLASFLESLGDEPVEAPA